MGKRDTATMSMSRCAAAAYNQTIRSSTLQASAHTSTHTSNMSGQQSRPTAHNKQSLRSPSVQTSHTPAYNQSRWNFVIDRHNSLNTSGSGTEMTDAVNHAKMLHRQPAAPLVWASGLGRNKRSGMNKRNT